MCVSSWLPQLQVEGAPSRSIPVVSMVRSREFLVLCWITHPGHQRRGVTRCSLLAPAGVPRDAVGLPVQDCARPNVVGMASKTRCSSWWWGRSGYRRRLSNSASHIQLQKKLNRPPMTLSQLQVQLLKLRLNNWMKLRAVDKLTATNGRAEPNSIVWNDKNQPALHVPPLADHASAPLPAQ